MDPLESKDSKRININQEYEVQYWTNRFYISRHTLLLAVEKVGDDIDAVIRYLDE